jgi:acetolactate synthase small subunit
MNPTHPIRTLRILVENRHGALLKIVGVFTTRAYNIHSLHVTPDQGEELSQMTVATRCDARQCELLRKQLMKIVDVVTVEEEPPQDELIANMNSGGHLDGDHLLQRTR